MKKITAHSCLVVALVVMIASAVYPQQSSTGKLQLDELDGSVSNLSEYLRVGPVYLSFWALWCEPCKQELRALKTVAKEHEDKPFTILAINQDSPKSVAKVKAYVRSQGYQFPVILDPNAQLFKHFNGQNLPFSVLLDKNGNIVSTRTGYLSGDEKEIEKEILKLLRE